MPPHIFYLSLLLVFIKKAHQAKGHESLFLRYLSPHNLLTAFLNAGFCSGCQVEISFIPITRSCTITTWQLEAFEVAVFYYFCVRSSIKSSPLDTQYFCGRKHSKWFQPTVAIILHLGNFALARSTLFSKKIHSLSKSIGRERFQATDLQLFHCSIPWRPDYIHDSS